MVKGLGFRGSGLGFMGGLGVQGLGPGCPGSEASFLVDRLGFGASFGLDLVPSILILQCHETLFPLCNSNPTRPNSKFKTPVNLKQYWGCFVYSREPFKHFLAGGCRRNARASYH